MALYETGYFDILKTPQTEVVQFAASTQKQLKINRAGYVSHIDILLKLVYDVASGGMTEAQDSKAKSFSSLKIRDAGANSYYEVVDGRQSYYDSLVQYHGNMRDDTLGTTASTSYTRYLHIPIHFGYDPFDPFDDTVVINELEVGDLYLDLTWAAATALGSGATLSTSSQAEVTVYRYVLEKGTSELKKWPKGVPHPRTVATNEALNSVQSDLGWTYDVDNNYIVTRSTLVVLATGGARSDADVTEFGIVFPHKSYKPHRTKIEQGKADLMALHQCSFSSAITGLGIIDWSQISRDELGFDVSTFEKGAVQIGCTTTLATGNLLILSRYVRPGPPGSV